MADAVDVRPTLGTMVRAVSGRWGWFVVVGAIELILGGVAATNLLAANLASVLVIGGMMVASGILQIGHAFVSGSLRGFLLWQLAGIVYAAAGLIIIYDPVLASFTLSLAAGALLVVAGTMRVWGGFHARPAAGWRWIVAAGALTICVGGTVLAAWPAIGLWFLGAMLVVDLVFQGWGMIAFGAALKVRAARRQAKPM